MWRKIIMLAELADEIPISDVKFHIFAGKTM